MTPADGSSHIDTSILAIRDRILPTLKERIPAEKAQWTPRVDISREAKHIMADFLSANRIELNLLDQRDLVTMIVNSFVAESGATAAPAAPATASDPPPVQAVQAPAAPATAAPVATPAPPPLPPAHTDAPTPLTIRSVLPASLTSNVTLNSLLEPHTSTADPYGRNPSRATIDQAKLKLQPIVLERIDTSAAAKMARKDLSRDLTGLVTELLIETRIQLNAPERQEVVKQLLDDMLGLGPLEPLLADETISEVMVNGPKQVYIEHQGKLILSDVQFRDNAHVLGVATRIVTAIGRRIDESSPLCDARLMDGSRVNIIIPPLAIDGPTITIRKFSKKKITLDTMLKFGSISQQMQKVLRICGRCRLNILISGGTGSGKTTLLNALSQMIDHGERVVTIEDAAELQLQQPHVVRLETRPANLEGHGEISMRDLVKNALRMRPDRIIVGETRGGEALDMLQAMNTGHDGSLSTVHANRPREALMRLENLVGMGVANLSPRAIRQQIASAVDMIIQVSRLRDGSRRVTYISEITGMEGDVITMQDLFTCDITGETPDGKLTVDFKNNGMRPNCLPKAAYFGLDKQLLEAMDFMTLSNPIIYAILGGGAFLFVLLVLSAFTDSDADDLDRRIARVGPGGNVRKLTTSSDRETHAVRRTTDSGIPMMNILIGMLPNPDKLRARLVRTGKDFTLGEYLLVSVLLVFLLALIFHSIGWSQVLVVPLSLGFGVGLPHFVIGYMGARRGKKFLASFPEAIDTMCRGIRSGLPVTESIAAVGREMPDPVGIEFHRIADGVRMGRSLEAAMWEVAKRISAPEFRFLIIAMAIQKETGGNLAETLGNLADLIRKRRQLRLKIKAMSSEARASAMIIGSLPFVMFTLLLVVNSDYIMTLFNNTGGKILMGIGVAWMSTGWAVMTKMIHFEI